MLPKHPVPLEQLFTHIQSLQRREVREREHRFWIEGIRHFVQASDANFEFDAIVYSRILLKSDLAEMLARRLRGRGVLQVNVTPEQFRRISTSARASGIGAIVRRRWTELPTALPQGNPCWLVLEEIRSPGNLGTILRTAEACGVAGIIFIGNRCDPFDPTVVRATMGGIFHLPMIRTSADRLKRWADRHGVHLVGLAPEARVPWTELPQGAPLAILIGEERKGLSPSLRKVSTLSVSLPMKGNADSLNVGVATGIVLYELMRRSLVGAEVTFVR